MQIPSFIDRSALTIQRAGVLDAKALKSEIQAVDPQGDTVLVRREQEDMGNTGMMPEVKLTVSYTHLDPAEVVERKSIGSDEAYDLYRCLKHAKTADGVKIADAGWILADLAAKGGAGGAC